MNWNRFFWNEKSKSHYVEERQAFSLISSNSIVIFEKVYSIRVGNWKIKTPLLRTSTIAREVWLERQYERHKTFIKLFLQIKWTMLLGWSFRRFTYGTRCLENFTPRSTVSSARSETISDLTPSRTVCEHSSFQRGFDADRPIPWIVAKLTKGYQEVPAIWISGNLLTFKISLLLSRCLSPPTKEAVKASDRTRCAWGTPHFLL